MLENDVFGVNDFAVVSLNRGADRRLGVGCNSCSYWVQVTLATVGRVKKVDRVRSKSACR